MSIKAQRLVKVTFLNWLGDSILSIAGGCAVIGIVLFASQILMDLQGHK